MKAGCSRLEFSFSCSCLLVFCFCFLWGFLSMLIVRLKKEIFLFEGAFIRWVEQNPTYVLFFLSSFFFLTIQLSHLFKVNSTNVFSTSTEFCHHRNQFNNIFITPKRNHVPFSSHSVFLHSSIFILCRFPYSTHLVKIKPYNTWPFITGFFHSA